MVSEKILFNQLFDAGHEIVYWTARGGNSGKDHTTLTKKQLDQWGVKRTKLMMGKPPYDYWIDDKAFNVDSYFMTDSHRTQTTTIS